MSGLEFLAIAGCIAAICSAYADGTELVSKIKERRRARKALESAAAQDDSTQSLELSLQMNRTIIQTQYDRDIGRLGPVFAQGDQESREMLKDIIIHLQRQVISNLKVAWHEDTHVNFLPLQDVADGSGDRAIDCLRQLHDRLAPSREIYRPPVRMAIEAPRGFVEPLSRDSTWEVTRPTPLSSSKRTISSEEGKKQRRMLPLFRSRPKSVEAVQQHQPPPPPPPPTNLAAGARTALPEEFPAANVQKEQAHHPELLLADFHLEAERNTNKARLNSTSTTQSKTLEPNHIEFNAWADAESPHGSHRNSEASSLSQVFPPTPESTDIRYFPSPSPLQTMRKSPPQDAYWSHGGTRDSQGSFGSTRSSVSTSAQRTSLPFQPFHPDNVNGNMTYTNTSGTQALPHDFNGLPQCTPEEYFRLLQAQMTTPTVPAAPAAPAISYQRQLSSIDRSAVPINGGKSLMPGEHNNYAGFCKGAWRMQIGERKKVMEERQKPASMLSTMRPYWQCSAKKCHFEGKMMQDKQGKKAIDMRVISSNGVFLRWSFLFKSHIHVNRDLEDPNKATFGCIFCCGEGQGTPMIGGLETFLQHLQIHRQKPPQGEVLYRINCIIGRTPQPGEEFDIVLA